MDILIKNSVLCRACLCSSNDFQSLFSKEIDCCEDEEKQICELYLECTEILVMQADGLPDAICLDCIEELTAFYKFRQKCQASENELRTLNSSVIKEAEVEVLQEIIVPQPLTEQPVKINAEDEEEISEVASKACPNCLKYFNNNADLVEHIETEHPDADHGMASSNGCCLCSDEFHSRVDLWKHIRSDHAEIHILDCGYCEYHSAEIKDMELHLLNSHQINFLAADDSIAVHYEDESTNADNIQDQPETLEMQIESPLNDMNDNDSNVTYNGLEEYLESDENETAGDVKQEETMPNKTYNCSICMSTYKTTKELYTCMHSHNEDKKFRCNEKRCKQSFFATQEELDIHNTVYHTTIIDNKCPKCDKQFPSLKNLKSHMRIHTSVRNYKCRFCLKAFTFSHHLKNHEKIHETTELYECLTCKKTFITKDRLGLHERIHTNNKPHKCTQCPKSFISKTSLDIHYAKHSDEKPFMCTICGWRLKTEQFLRTHMKIKHYTSESAIAKKKETLEKNRDNYCKICDKMFSSTLEYKKHAREHCYKYKCEECNKLFALNSTYEMHMKRHQRQITTKHECPQCEAVYHRSDLLRYHVLRNHSNGKFPFECSVCGKGFIQSGDYKTHKRRHSNKRIYACDHCSKSYVTSSALAQHKRVHTGERPYVCSICEKSFATAHQLNFHAEKHATAKQPEFMIIEETFIDVIEDDEEREEEDLEEHLVAIYDDDEDDDDDDGIIEDCSNIVNQLQDEI